MDINERWEHLVALDEELLQGGSMLSEWCSFIVREADTAFANGAHLASILTAVSGIETYLRSEYPEGPREGLARLIDRASIGPELKADLHELRRYRNKWVHVNEPWNDEALLAAPEKMEAELEQMAFFAARQLRRTIYENPGSEDITNWVVDADVLPAVFACLSAQNSRNALTSTLPYPAVFHS